MRYLARGLTLAVLVRLLACTALAQTAQIQGQVTDPQKAVIPNAEVRIINQATGVERKTKTNDVGMFSVPFLEPGHYKITVQAQGFNTAISDDLTLNVGQALVSNFELKVGATEQTVTVRGGTPLVNTQDATVGTVVDRRFVENMPLNGRTFQSLITLTPGVVLVNSLDDGQFSVNGQRANANYFMVDGVSANIAINSLNQPGQSAAGSVPGFSAFGSTSNLVSVDALQEFRVQTSSFAPEFGRTPGAQVSIVTRPGTNEFHGSAFDYVRNDVFDANDWFANRAGKPRAPERQNDFGGTFSGPVLHNRTFFFFSYEGLRLRLPKTAITSVPSLNARSMAPATMQPFLNAYPIPNGPDLGGNLAPFAASYSDPSSLDATGIRIDHTVSSKLTLFGRYNYSPSSSSSRAVRSSLNTVNSVSLNTHTLTGGATLAISPALSNEFRANFSSNSGTSSASLDTFGGAKTLPDSLLFPTPFSSHDSIFAFSIVSGTNAILSQGRFSFQEQRQINLVDTFSIAAGRHQLKFGTDYRRLFPIEAFFHYSLGAQALNMTQAIAGQVFVAAIQATSGSRFPILSSLSLFGQDTWNISRGLTLTYGLRWELNPPPHEKNGHDPFALTDLNNLSTLTLAPPGTPLYSTTHTNFAPRVGLAYQLMRYQGRETVLRGGFGIFYDTGSGQDLAQFGLLFPSGTVKVIVAPSGLPFPLDSASAAPSPISLTPPFPQIAGAIDPNLKLPYTYQWTVGVEQALGSSQLLTVSYVAAIGRRLTRQEILSRPNSNFSSTIRLTRNSATSDYHALQLQFQRRLTNGLQALVSYTWSHSLDDVSSDSSFEAPLGNIDLSKERGPSIFDVRHAFSAAVTYEIPAPHRNGFASALLRNFSLDPLFRTRSALPVNVITGTAIVGGFAGPNGVSRPDLIPGVPLYVSDPNVAGGRKINSAAFKIPVGRQGTLGRNALRGFSMWQLDLALRRQVGITERLKLQVHAELFNIFNHPNFGDPGANQNGTNVVTNPQFGQSLNMLSSSQPFVGGGLNPLYQVGGPRSIQLALKLLF